MVNELKTQNNILTKSDNETCFPGKLLNRIQNNKNANEQHRIETYRTIFEKNSPQKLTQKGS